MDETSWKLKYEELETKIKTLCGSDTLDEGLSGLNLLISDFHKRYPDLPPLLHISTINKCISAMKSEQEWKRDQTLNLYDFLRICTPEQKKIIESKIKWLVTMPYIGGDYFAAQYRICIESYIAHETKK
jgi:hypothetical protein